MSTHGLMDFAITPNSFCKIHILGPSVSSNRPTHGFKNQNRLDDSTKDCT